MLPLGTRLVGDKCTAIVRHLGISRRSSRRMACVIVEHRVCFRICGTICGEMSYTDDISSQRLKCAGENKLSHVAGLGTSTASAVAEKVCCARDGTL